MNTELAFHIDSTDDDYVFIQFADCNFIYTDDHLWVVDTYVGDSNWLDIGYYPEAELDTLCNDIAELYEDGAFPDMLEELAEMK